jgi:hypothetical protein
MRGQYESRLRRIENRSTHTRLCVFTSEETDALRAIERKYLGRDATREDVRARSGPLCEIADEDLVIVVDCVKATRRRGLRG